LILGAYVLGAATVMLQALLLEELRPFRDAFVFAAVIAVLVCRPRVSRARVGGEPRMSRPFASDRRTGGAASACGGSASCSG
jgi:hypothetical protein